MSICLFHGHFKTKICNGMIERPGDCPWPAGRVPTKEEYEWLEELRKNAKANPPKEPTDEELALAVKDLFGE